MKIAQPLAEEWTQALCDFLAREDEAALARAYALGRRALAEGLGPLALSQLHALALDALPPSGPQGFADRQRRAWRFFSEAVAASELALRGYREAVSGLRELNRTLEARVEQRSQELLQAERRYRSLVEQLPGTIYSAPADPLVPMGFVSPQIQTLTGFTPAEWAQLPGRWGGRLLEDDQERVMAELRRALQDGSDFRAEYRLLRKDGRIVWVRDEARPEPNSEGARLQGIMLDVTQMRALEEGLRQAQKLEAIGRIASGVAHDFNNVLTAILSFSRFVREDLGPDHPSRADVDEILHSAERGTGLTRQLLLFSRGQSTRSGPVDLGATVEGMLRMLRRLVGDKVKITLRAEPDLPPVFADPAQLEQILLNLVINAGDAMQPGGGEVLLVVARAPEGEARGQRFVQLRVRDTGAGMDAQTRARIFEPFFTTKAPGKGTGLGLATVHSIVQKLGGRLEVESAPGEGTEFSLLLPPSPEEGPADEGPAEGAVQGSETLLLVEVDPGVRAAAARALRGAGFCVLEAGSQQEALEQSQRFAKEIHLLVSDVVLGQGLGTDLGAKLLSQRPGLRALYTTGHGPAELVRRGAHLEHSPLLQKPFSPDQFLRAVRRVLDGKDPR